MAGIVAVLVYQQRVLLILRDDKQHILNPLRWSLPTGGVEGVDGSALKAAEREISEELGINIRLQEIGTSRQGNIFFYSQLSAQQAHSISLKEGCAWSFFSADALAAVNKRGEIELGLCGALKRRCMDHFTDFKALIEDGVFPPKRFFET